MIWLLAALDLVAGVYLLRRALPREGRRQDAVRGVGLMLLLCAVTLVGTWRAATAESPLPPVEPGRGLSV